MLPDRRGEVAQVTRIAKGLSLSRCRRRRDLRLSMRDGSSDLGGPLCATSASVGALVLVAGLTALLATTGAKAEGPSDLVPVRAITPKTTEMSPDIELSGQIQARIQTNIAFRISGKVIERRVETGDHVTKDQVLAVLDERRK